LQQELVGQLAFKRNSGEPRSGLVKPLHGRLESRGLLDVGQELGLERQLHVDILVGTISPAQEEEDIPPPPKDDGPLSGFLWKKPCRVRAAMT
jgi:hypothetical protein